MIKDVCDVTLSVYSYCISIKVVPEQSGKVEYEREGLLGIAMKIHFLLDFCTRLFRFARGQP
jgi:hypothetical protein